jgi:Transport and Golgi organisation 2
MCTVTFWPRNGGFLLGMNRDEQRIRPIARPPAVVRQSKRSVLHPSEPSGGTWITVNDAGVVLALINWYAKPTPPVADRLSRGAIPVYLAGCNTAADAQLAIGGLPLPRVAPFRLIGIFGRGSACHEWRWDGFKIDAIEHGCAPRQWASSGFDEAGAQRARTETFDRGLGESDAGSIPWLRRLHADHGDHPGPYSTCMHRTDAATVSYTEIELSPTTLEMRYSAAPLCQATPLTVDALPVRHLDATHSAPTPKTSPTFRQSPLRATLHLPGSPA